MQRCPNCRGRLKEMTTCQRCGNDLALPMKIEAEAEALYLQSIVSVEQGDMAAAMLLVDQALELRRLPLFELWRRFLLRREKCDT